MNNLPMSQYRLFESLIVRWTRVGIVGVGLVTLLLGGSTLYLGTVTKSKETELRKLEPSLRSAKGALAQQIGETGFPRRSAYEAVRDFQRTFEELARDRGCTITTFQMTGEPTAHSSSSSGGKSDLSLIQSSVRFELRGKSLDVVSTLRQITSRTVPFEFDSLELRREKVYAEGAEITAAGSLHVVGEAPGGKTS